MSHQVYPHARLVRTGTPEFRAACMRLCTQSPSVLPTCYLPVTKSLYESGKTRITTEWRASNSSSMTEGHHHERLQPFSYLAPRTVQVLVPRRYLFWIMKKNYDTLDKLVSLYQNCRRIAPGRRVNADAGTCHWLCTKNELSNVFSLLVLTTVPVQLVVNNAFSNRYQVRWS